MDEHSFDVVWPSPSDAVRAEVVEFWLAEAAMPEGRAVERARQLLVVCRDAGGAVVAVSTAVPSVAPTLGLSCFYFRAFVGRAHRVRGLRGSSLIYRLIRASYDALNERFQRGIDSEMVGLYFEVENASVTRRRNDLVWKDLDANIVYVGMLPGGSHARVWYFDNARLPADR